MKKPRIKFKNFWLWFSDQVLRKKAFYNFFISRNAWGAFSINSHIRGDNHQRPGGLGTGSGGDGRFAPAIARAAVATGVDGVFMETHLNPKEAKSDGPNCIRLSEVEKLWKTLKKINEIVKG